MQELLMTYEDKMEKSLNNLNEEFATIRAGRANPHILDKIKIDYMEHRHLFSRLAIFQFRRQE